MKLYQPPTRSRRRRGAEPPPPRPKNSRSRSPVAEMRRGSKVECAGTECLRDCAGPLQANVRVVGGFMLTFTNINNTASYHDANPTGAVSG